MPVSAEVEIVMSDSSLPEFDKLWKFHLPEETEQTFRALLPQAQASGDINYHAELLTQIARCEGLQNKFDEAHQTLDAVEEMLDATNDRVHVRYLLERGRAFNSGGYPTEAATFFESAYELGARIGEWSLAVDAVHMVAIAREDVAEQIEWNLKGVALAEAHPEARGWLFALYNNLGEAYARAGEYQHALETFTKLEAFHRERGREVDKYLIKDLARMHRMLGHPDQSYAMMSPIANELSAAGERDGWIAEELAESLHALGRTDEAKPQFVTAYELLSQDSYCLEFEPAKIERLRQMAGD